MSEKTKKETVMDDSKIVDLYWARDEKAIDESDKKYGRMLTSLSFSLLSSLEDAEECVNDTYIDAWGAMPTARPEFLGAFLSKIVRRISVDRFREKHRQKRGGIENSLSELSECIPASGGIEEELDGEGIREELDEFLRSQTKEKRVAFILRYFYSKSITEIALKLGVGESKVKTMLFRMRAELRERLEVKGLL
jgi:RNA polymerase sigma-70 factor (ECF subfamily)